MTQAVHRAPVPRELEELVDRSHRLGSEKRFTNQGGGNTSAKLVLADPVTGAPTDVLAVKGSGGDLATLSTSGLALLDLDRLRALETVHASGVREDALVEMYGYCRFGDGGAVPSIDTPLHALLEAPHVDHLHPDAIIALAACVDGAALVERCFGAQVGWLDWLRPGFELALALRDLVAGRPTMRAVVLGGHGVIAWGVTSDECEANSRELIRRAEEFLAEYGRPDPFGSLVAARAPLPGEQRRGAALRLAPVVRGVASSEGWNVGHFVDSDVVLDFLASDAAPRLAALGTSCPDHFLRTKVRPLFLDTPADTPVAVQADRLQTLHTGYRDEYRAYYERFATADSPPMRSADPVIVLVPGIGMWGFGRDPASAEIATEYYVNAINVMRGAESVASYVTIPDAEKFRVEYWELEERKLGSRPPARALAGRVALVTGAASGIGRAIVERLAAEDACVVLVDIDLDRAEKVGAAIGADRSLALRADIGCEADVERAFTEAVLRFGGVDLVVNNAGFAAAARLVDTTADEWDRLHAVLARGAFLVSRAAARTMIPQGRGGDIVYIVSKNSVVAGPENVAYGAAKADQAHQVRLLAAELGAEGIRVNGVNPDGVVEGSGIFSGQWREQRAAAYGVEPEDLGSFYAGRTLLGREVLPAHIAEAVLALTSGALSRTTGLIVPVDGGVPSAFLR